VTTTNDNQQRAAEFLRQWQEQMTKQMTNPDAIRAMLDAMQHFGKPAHDANARRPAHAPDARDDAIGDYAKRLLAVERQLSALGKQFSELHARVDAAKKPARASNRPSASAVEKNKRPVAKRKPVAKPKRKPAAKRK
jgi:hypothetical protein